MKKPKPLSLGDKQRLFMKLIPRLMDYAYKHGYALSMGDAYRDPRVFGMVGVDKGYGAASSNHKIRLAMDFNLFRLVDGRWEYCSASEDHRFLGEYWESLNPLCSWGGRFNDGNHYSMEHNGRR